MGIAEVVRNLAEVGIVLQVDHIYMTSIPGSKISARLLNIRLWRVLLLLSAAVVLLGGHGERRGYGFRFCAETVRAVL